MQQKANMNWYTLTELIQVFYDIKWMRSVLLNLKKPKPSDPLKIDPGAHKKTWCVTCNKTIFNDMI
jgi:hypothetical protein